MHRGGEPPESYLIQWRTWGGVELMEFRPLAPVTPFHRLIVPVLHARHAADSPTLAAAAMGAAAEYAQGFDAANIITSIGEAATQAVGHLHLHVVPRTPGDGLPLPWTPQQEAAR